MFLPIILSHLSVVSLPACHINAISGIPSFHFSTHSSLPSSLFSVRTKKYLPYVFRWVCLLVLFSVVAYTAFWTAAATSAAVTSSAAASAGAPISEEAAAPITKAAVTSAASSQPNGGRSSCRYRKKGDSSDSLSFGKIYWPTGYHSAPLFVHNVDTRQSIKAFQKAFFLKWQFSLPRLSLRLVEPVSSSWPQVAPAPAFTRLPSTAHPAAARPTAAAVPLTVGTLASNAAIATRESCGRSCALCVDTSNVITIRLCTQRKMSRKPSSLPTHLLDTVTEAYINPSRRFVAEGAEAAVFDDDAIVSGTPVRSAVFSDCFAKSAASGAGGSSTSRLSVTHRLQRLCSSHTKSQKLLSATAPLAATEKATAATTAAAAATTAAAAATAAARAAGAAGSYRKGSKSNEEWIQGVDAQSERLLPFLAKLDAICMRLLCLNSCTEERDAHTSPTAAISACNDTTAQDDDITRRRGVINESANGGSSGSNANIVKGITGFSDSDRVDVLLLPVLKTYVRSFCSALGSNTTRSNDEKASHLRRAKPAGAPESAVARASQSKIAGVAVKSVGPTDASHDTAVPRAEVTEKEEGRRVASVRERTMTESSRKRLRVTCCGAAIAALEKSFFQQQLGLSPRAASSTFTCNPAKAKEAPIPMKTESKESTMEREGSECSLSEYFGTAATDDANMRDSEAVQLCWGNSSNSAEKKRFTGNEDSSSSSSSSRSNSGNRACSATDGRQVVHTAAGVTESLCATKSGNNKRSCSEDEHADEMGALDLVGEKEKYGCAGCVRGVISAATGSSESTSANSFKTKKQPDRFDELIFPHLTNSTLNAVVKLLERPPVGLVAVACYKEKTSLETSHAAHAHPRKKQIIRRPQQPHAEQEGQLQQQDDKQNQKDLSTENGSQMTEDLEPQVLVVSPIVWMRTPLQRTEDSGSCKGGSSTKTQSRNRCSTSGVSESCSVCDVMRGRTGRRSRSGRCRRRLLLQQYQAGIHDEPLSGDRCTVVPFPTTLWLCGQQLRREISVVEGTGFTRRVEELVRQDKNLQQRMIDDALRYIALRWLLVDQSLLRHFYRQRIAGGAQVVSQGVQQLSLSKCNRLSPSAVESWSSSNEQYKADVAIAAAAAGKRFCSCRVCGYLHVLRERGVGGTCNFLSVRCLHMFYAFHLLFPSTVVGLLLEKKLRDGAAIDAVADALT